MIDVYWESLDPPRGGPPTVGQKGEVSQKFAKAYEFAFGSEVAELRKECKVHSG